MGEINAKNFFVKKFSALSKNFKLWVLKMIKYIYRLFIPFSKFFGVVGGFLQKAPYIAVSPSNQNLTN